MIKTKLKIYRIFVKSVDYGFASKKIQFN